MEGWVELAAPDMVCWRNGLEIFHLGVSGEGDELTSAARGFSSEHNSQNRYQLDLFKKR